MARELTIALVQHPCGADRAANLRASLDGIAEAAGRGARLVLLQELHGTRYFCQAEDPALFDLAEPVPGPTTEALAAAARHHGVVVVGSLFERRGPGLHHNTAVVLEADGTLAGTYRKMHVPQDPGYREKYYFAPGDQGFRPVATSVGRLGVMVCWDQWFPEAARLMALAGAELLLYPTAIGWDPRDDAAERARQHEAWMVVQRGHAVANALPVAACNRVGHEPGPPGEPGIVFWGSSFVVGPQGELLAQGSREAAQVVVATLDLDRSEALRRVWTFFRDRRPEAYGGLCRAWGAGGGDAAPP